MSEFESQDIESIVISLRGKIDTAKVRAQKWKDKSLQQKDTIESLKEIQEQLRDNVSSLEDKIESLESDLHDRNMQISDLKDTSEYDEALQDLRGENSKLKKKMNKLNTDNQREILKRDTELDRIRASLEDYKERYKEIRDDNKELRKNLKV